MQRIRKLATGSHLRGSVTGSLVTRLTQSKALNESFALTAYGKPEVQLLRIQIKRHVFACHFPYLRRFNMFDYPYSHPISTALGSIHKCQSYPQVASRQGSRQTTYAQLAE